MDESRRDFLKGLGLVAGAGLLGLPLAPRGFAQPPGGVGVRRNVMELDPNGRELADYRRAVEVLRSLAPSDRRSWYGQAEIHLGFCPHGNWFFLPWHRAYLAAFERLCRAACGNPQFMLPTGTGRRSARCRRRSSPACSPTARARSGRTTSSARSSSASR